jgi:hypothetical protein
MYGFLSTAQKNITISTNYEKVAKFSLKIKKIYESDILRKVIFGSTEESLYFLPISNRPHPVAYKP